MRLDTLTNRWETEGFTWVVAVAKFEYGVINIFGIWYEVKVAMAKAQTTN